MKLAMVGIIVKDMEESIAFYKCLGMHIRGQFDANYVELEHEGIRISLNSLTMITGVYGFTPQSTGDKVELAFETTTTTEVDSLCETLKTSGYEIFKTPWDAPWGQRYAIVKDPNANLISLFCNL